MGIDPASFWANLFLNSFKGEYMSFLISLNKVKAKHFHSTKTFNDEYLYAINNDG